MLKITTEFCLILPMDKHKGLSIRQPLISSYYSAFATKYSISFAAFAAAMGRNSP